MLETKEKVINGRTYTVGQLPAMRALKLLTKIGKVAGPALASAQGLDADIGKAAGALFDRLDENDVETIIKQLMETVQITEDGKTRPAMAGFDLTYAGDGLVELFGVIQFALEVQFGSFFVALGAVANRPAPQAAKASG